RGLRGRVGLGVRLHARARLGVRLRPGVAGRRRAGARRGRRAADRRRSRGGSRGLGLHAELGRGLGIQLAGRLQTLLLLVVTQRSLGLGPHFAVDLARIVTLVLERLVAGAWSVFVSLPVAEGEVPLLSPLVLPGPCASAGAVANARATPSANAPVKVFIVLPPAAVGVEGCPRRPQLAWRRLATGLRKSCSAGDASSRA